MVRFFLRSASLAALIAVNGTSAFAQTVNQGSGAVPRSQTPAGDVPAPGRPAPPPGAGGGLPDAVTVLNILRGLPRYPIGQPSGSSGFGPQPKTGASVKIPNRVVTVDPGQSFKANPYPRAAALPPIEFGAVVPEVKAREILVTLPVSADGSSAEALSRDLGLDAETLYVSNLLGARVVRLRIPDARSIADVERQISGDARVQIAQPNYVFTASQGAASPVAGDPVSLPVPQYAPQKLHLGEAHKVAQGKAVKIAVIDTAVDIAHPAFANSVAASFDALGEAAPEPEAHGTAIAAIVGARAELTGVAPAANILSARAFTAAGKAASAESDTLAILKALDWAVLNGARVINMSFAGPNDILLGHAISAAVKQGVVVVAAAGNGGPSAQPAYPGAYPSVIAVTAVDDKDGVYKNANRGTYIALAAPGVDIVAAAPKGAYEISSGTSMAAAHVSGIAALMLERNPKLTPKEIRDALSKTAHRMDKIDASDIGAGVADAAEALAAVK